MMCESALTGVVRVGHDGGDVKWRRPIRPVEPPDRYSGSGTFPFDDLDRQHGRPGRIVTGDPLQQALRHGTAQVGDRLPDRRQLRNCELRFPQVVETDDSDVVGHPASGLLDCSHRSDRHQVGCREHGVDVGISGEQLAHHAVPALDGEVANGYEPP